eukprot:scaffold663567_cov47-Prasinocladus_malaysianus.AAC.1
MALASGLVKQLGLSLLASKTSLAAPLAVGGLRLLGRRGMALWSVEKEKGQRYKDPDEIVNAELIERELNMTKETAKDPEHIKQILKEASKRSFLTDYNPGSMSHNAYC